MVKRDLENLEPEISSQSSHSESRNKDIESKLYKSRIRGQSGKLRTPIPLSSESEFASIAIELKQSTIDARTKQNLTRFFNRHQKAEENLKMREMVRLYNMEEKRVKQDNRKRNVQNRS